MNALSTRSNLGARIFAGALLGLAALAAAHHGNPDVPAPAPWNSSSAGTSGPARPLAPGF